MSSTDKQVTTDLIEILEDGRKGFAAAAETVFAQVETLREAA